MKKWMKVVESVPPILANGTDQSMKIKRDATVMVDPRAGGGTGRFMDYIPGGARVDIKGVAVELPDSDFSLPERDYQDPYQSGNEWFHSTEEPNTIGTMNDKPEFRPGDMVQVADVYGSVIGPGIGVFIAYSTTGKEAIVSFDDKEMLIPIANVGACLEQDAKDNFDEMDNDGNLSPMSLASHNVKIEQEPAMDQRDEFSKWLSKVEEALNGATDINMLPQSTGLCGCQDWKCQVCFPDQGPEEVVGGPDMNNQEACPMCGAECGGHDGPEVGSIGIVPEMEPEMAFPEEEMEVPMEGGCGMMDEEDMDFEEKPVQRGRDGKGVKLGDIVQKYVPVGDNSDGEDSPLSYGEDNLDEADFDMPGDDEMANQAEFASASDDDIMQMEEMASKIKYLQDMGLSKSPRMYSEADFASMSPTQLRACYQEVSGNNAAAQGEPTMEGIDQDIQVWLKKFKEYDSLVEASKPDFLDVDKDGDKDEPMKKALKDKEKDLDESADDKKPAFLKKGKGDDKKANDERNKKVGADVFKSNRGSDKKDDVKEAADPEVLEWMQRFSKLGNMKGYGR